MKSAQKIPMLETVAVLALTSLSDLTITGLILYDVNSTLEAEEGAASESI